MRQSRFSFFGQGTASNAGTDVHVVELVALGFATGFDVAQAFPVRELGKCHAPILILIAETLDVPVAIVALNTTSKGMQRHMIHRLREDKFACVHRLNDSIRNSREKHRPDRLDG